VPRVASASEQMQAPSIAKFQKRPTTPRRVAKKERRQSGPATNRKTMKKVVESSRGERKVIQGL